MTAPKDLHESFDRAGDAQPGSERAFGFVFAGFFALVGLWPLLSGSGPRPLALALAGLFAAGALFAPGLLKPLNRLWFRFGARLHRFVSPLVMGFLFYLTVTPVAFLMRMSGKDPLRLRFDRGAKSYWIERAPPGPSPETMRNQF